MIKVHQGLTKENADKERGWLTFEFDWEWKCDLKVVVFLVESGGGVLSFVLFFYFVLFFFLFRINVTMVRVHRESNRNKSPLASLAGY